MQKHTPESLQIVLTDFCLNTNWREADLAIDSVEFRDNIASVFVDNDGIEIELEVDLNKPHVCDQLDAELERYFEGAAADAAADAYTRRAESGFADA